MSKYTEFRARQRAKADADPEFAEKRRAAWRAQHEQKKRRRQNDPEYDKSVRAQNVRKSRRYTDRNPALQRDWHREKREQQADRPRPSRCECCGAAGGDKKPHLLVWDHDHSTGAFRGWICSSCNLALGHLKEDPERVRLLLTYMLRIQRGLTSPTTSA